jgi:hypothetical protein
MLEGVTLDQLRTFIVAADEREVLWHNEVDSGTDCPNITVEG